MGLALLLIPLFSYRQLVEMERLLFQSQSRAQLLTAQGISTLFNGREDLFEELPLDIDDFEPLYAQPIDSPINLDGVFDDWQGSISKKVNSFGDSNNSFELVLGERADFLYAFITIRDNSIVHRDPNYLRLDNADHLRLSFVRPDGRDGRVALIFPQSGEIEGFEMDEQWREERDADERDGVPERPPERPLERHPLAVAARRNEVAWELIFVAARAWRAGGHETAPESAGWSERAWAAVSAALASSPLPPPADAPLALVPAIPERPRPHRDLPRFRRRSR